ncbi:MAG: hypothetical protein LBQ12_09205 [Deltaproteobacteria bacterium]|jgi:hypothetical protein|nr:hypothetical protein [Deltaproteobacteria bacterium]
MTKNLPARRTSARQRPAPALPAFRPAFPLPVAFSLALALAAAIAPAATLSAQEGLNAQIFENQPPLTAADAPAAMEFMAATSGGPIQPDAVRQMAARHNITVERLFFASAKFMTGTLLLNPDGPPREEVARAIGNPRAIPDDAELEVVREALAQAKPSG